MAQRLSGLDSVFLSVESPGNWLHMMAILLLDPETVPGGYSFERFREFFRERIHLVPPLRRRLVEVPFGLGRPIWIEDPALDIDLHLRRASVPHPGGPAELAALAAEIDERPLDRSRPLWRMWVVEGVEGGRIAVIAKLHHAMMDGMAGMQFMASLFSREPESKAPPPAPPAGSVRTPSALRMLAGAVPGLAARPLAVARATLATASLALRHRLAAWFDPPEAEPERAVHVERTWLNRPISARRSVAFASVSLDRVKEVAAVTSATVNDVVLALVGDVLRRELRRRGELPATSLVAGVPVSTHDEGDDVANAYALAYVELATEMNDPVARLRAIRESARRGKRRQSNVIGDSLALWMDIPLPLELALFSRAYIGFGLSQWLPAICNVVVSNVPGPPVPLYLGGARLVGIHPLGPIFEGMVVNVTVLSREDSLDFGIVTCGDRIPDPWPLADGLSRALDELSERISKDPSVRRIRAVR